MEILDVERIEQKCYNFNSDKKINVLINRPGEVKKMDERIWTIAEILDQSGPMTADELAAQLKLSGKTVRSLIKTYAKEMQENGFFFASQPNPAGVRH